MRGSVCGLRAVAAALMGATALSGAAFAQVLPSGSLLSIDNGSAPNSATNTPNVFQDYSTTFTPTQTGNNYILFAFRQVPAFWTFGNVALTASGSATNLLTNPNFATGVPAGNSGFSMAPTGWGIVLQNGATIPAAHGNWFAPGTAPNSASSTSGLGVNTATSGSWYDGAIQSFDGIYQGVSLTAGTTYTISFTTLSQRLATSPTIELGTFAGACTSSTGPQSACLPPISSGFTPVFVPTAVTTNSIDTAQAFYLASSVGTTVAPAFQGGTLRMDQANGVYAENFTLDGSTTNTIDQFGNASTFSGAFTDAEAGTPGNIIIANTGSGGSVTFTGANTYTGTTTIDQAATLIIGAGGSITNSSTLFNSGTLQVDALGAVTVGGITNNATGAILNNGTITDALDNSGLVVNNATFNADVSNASTGFIANNGTWTGSVLSNSGTILNPGIWNAVTFTNSSGGLVATVGTLNATTSITNAGTLFAAGVVTTPLLVNSGVLQVDALGALTVGGITNNSTGSIFNNGTIIDALDNSGSVFNNAVYNADVSNASTGSIANNGTWTGSVLSNSGTVLNTGTWNAATFANSSGGLVTTTGTLTATTSVTNAGTFNAEGALTTPLFDNTGTFTVTGPLTGSLGTFNNAGTVDMRQVGAATGVLNTTTFNNTGTVNMVDGKTTGVLRTTTFNGQGGIVAIDVEPTSTAATQRADLVSTTNVSGTTKIDVHVVGANGLISNPIPVVSAASVAPGTSITLANNPGGLINYSIEQSGANFNLVSTVNTSAATAAPAGIDSILTGLSTGFFQNASAFIAEPAKPEPNQWNGGPWVRFADGRNDINVQTSAQNPNGVAHAASSIRAKFSGFQTGVDLGLANIENSGWNTHLGVTSGQVVLGTSDLIGLNISSSVQVPFIGIYGAVTGHNFFADFQVRGDFYNIQVSNPAAFLRGAGLHGGALAVNGSAGYRIDLPESWFVEPSIAFLYSQLKVDSLRVNLDSAGLSFGYLDFNPFTSALGRVGARVGTSFLLDEQLVLQPFGTASVWREFAGNSTTTFVTPGASALLEVQRIGTFGQVGIGISGQFVKSGVLGFARGDYRFGDHISGYAAVVGLRYQF